MNWLTRVRDKIPFIAKKDTPENLWHKCPGCSQMVFVKEYEENLSVCPVCDHHGRIGPKERFAWVLRHVEGYQLEEVADACECSLATAKRWIAKADERVRQHVRIQDTRDVEDA